MLPFHVKLGPVVLGPEQALVVLGFLAAAFAAWPRLRELGLARTDLFDLALAGLLGGSAGAKLFYALPLWIRGIEPAPQLLSTWSAGSAFYGGLMGGLLAVAGVTRLKRRPVIPVLDAGAAALPLGFTLGKVGCFLEGCCYGPPASVPPGMRFAPGSLAYEAQKAARLLPADSVSSRPVHPTQLYEAAFGILLFFGLGLLRRHFRKPGELFLAFVLLYSTWRFGIEFLRDDPGRHLFGARVLSDSQIVALPAAGAAGLAWIFLRRRMEAS
ncbi:MAG: prolipoprotein diacylglyceryl transferase [Planctomycetes bacterium]|nr:prolipoprotein diacylglyceryl transferase [Planctomycetota bacterium]